MLVRSQVLNSVLLVEDFDSYEFCLNDDNQTILTYEKIWWHDNGNSEPSYDSSGIFLTRLDSMANPVGDLWELRRNSTSVQGSPHVAIGNNQISWMYTNFESNDLGYQSSMRARLFDDQVTSPEDELIIVEETGGSIYSNHVMLNDNRYLAYWATGSNFEMRTIFGQLYSQANQVLGDEFIIYQALESDTLISWLGRTILSINNASSGMTYLIWNEHVFNIPEYQAISQLKILRLGNDGQPLENPRVISERIETSYVTYNLYLQNDTDLILTYKTREDLEDYSILYESWIHVVNNYSEDSEAETIYQLPTPQIMQASYFPKTGDGVFVYNNGESDSLYAQRFDPSGGSIDSPVHLPFSNHFTYPEYQCLLQDRKLFLFESQIFHELYAHIFLLPQVVSIESPRSNRPDSFTLFPPYPNPFNPSTIIAYQLSKHSNVTLHIYDVQGRMIQTLVDDAQQAGEFSRLWNGTDSDGNHVSGGLYFIKLRAGQYVQTMKLVLLR